MALCNPGALGGEAQGPLEAGQGLPRFPKPLCPLSAWQMESTSQGPAQGVSS